MSLFSHNKPRKLVQIYNSLYQDKRKGASLMMRIYKLQNFVLSIFKSNLRSWGVSLLLMTTAVSAMILLNSCSDGPEISRGSTDYDNNMFYTGQTSAPKHEKKVNLDFFNKECSPSGSMSSENGRQYECHYTGN